MVDKSIESWLEREKLPEIEILREKLESLELRISELKEKLIPRAEQSADTLDGKLRKLKGELSPEKKEAISAPFRKLLKKWEAERDKLELRIVEIEKGGAAALWYAYPDSNIGDNTSKMDSSLSQIENATGYIASFTEQTANLLNR